MIYILAARKKSSRKGTSAIETALILPVFLMFVLALVEIGHTQMVRHVLRSACRQAARIGSTEGNTTDDVRQRVLDVLSGCVPPEAVEVYVKDAGVFDSSTAPPSSGTDIESLADIEVANAQPRQLFLVRAKIRYEDVAIVPNIPILGSFLDNIVLEGQAFMRHE